MKKVPGHLKPILNRDVPCPWEKMCSNKSWWDCIVGCTSCGHNMNGYHGWCGKDDTVTSCCIPCQRTLSKPHSWRPG